MGDTGPFRVGRSPGVHGLTVYEDPEGGEKTGELWCLATTPHRADRIVTALNATAPAVDRELHNAATEELLPGMCADGMCEHYPADCPYQPYRVCVECTAEARAVGGGEAPVVMAAECGLVDTEATEPDGGES